MAVGGGGTGAGPITGYQGLCVDVRAANPANFTPVQVYTCNGTNAQQWTVVAAGSTLHALGKCMDINGGGTADGTTVDLYDCNNTAAQVFIPQSNGALYNPQSNKCLDDTGYRRLRNPAADLGLRRHRQPAVDPAVTRPARAVPAVTGSARLALATKGRGQCRHCCPALPRSGCPAGRPRPCSR